MDNEPYRDLTHRELKDAVIAQAAQADFRYWRELCLPNGKIADVLLLTKTGSIEIVECKTYCTDSLICSAWEKYGSFANCLWIASAAPFAVRSPWAGWPTSFTNPWDRIGLLHFQPSGLTVYRQAAHHPVADERARALDRLLLGG